MPLQPHSFKRLVLGLQPSAPDRIMQLAADLAEVLDLELLGLFLEDSSLRDLAGIPFAREFSPLGGGWRAMDVDRLTHELEVAAHSTERMFTDAVKRLPIKCEFEVIRGPIADIIASVSRTGDIVMILEPANAAERATQQFSWLIEGAFQSAAAVMLVPSRIVRTAGPIVAIATGQDDPSIHAAAAIAKATKENLVIAEANDHNGDDAAIRRLAAETGVSVKRIPADNQPVSGAWAQTLHALRERLVVMTRGPLAYEAASSIASARHVPVLVIESPGAIDEER
jgi:hypothetical protein